MKSYFGKLFLLSILILLIQSCAVSQPRPEVVCITKTGTKYHRCSCRHVSRSGYEVTLEEAGNRNYSPCGVCKPQATGEEAKVNNSDSTDVDKIESDKPSNANAPVVAQCTAITKAGTRCKRKATSFSSKCWQHQEK
jgi:hypothetical protein